jgi:alkanesulfonate monooxygenase SsuD/methylene tetrahydromethanopterin reductase-like flavin-dependent oxidoreductase (luciferase family)
MTPLDRTPGQASDPARELALASHAAALGVAALWTRDVPLIIPQGIAQGNEREAAVLDEPFVWLSALAFAAPQAAIGTAAAVLPLRHPLHLAKAAWSLDRLSGGRMILGLGSGDRPEEFAAFRRGRGRATRCSASAGRCCARRWRRVRSRPCATAGGHRRLRADGAAERAHPAAGGGQRAPVAAMDRGACRRLGHLPPRGSAPAGPHRLVAARAGRARRRRR